MGVAIGAAIGVTLNNIAIGISSDIAIGAAFGTLKQNKNKKQ